MCRGSSLRCSGTLTSIVIPRPRPNSEPSPGVGKVFFEYIDTNGASKVWAGLNGRSILAYFTVGVNAQNDQEIVEDLQSLLVSPLLKRMGKVELQMEDNQMKIVFNCFYEISSQIGKKGCDHYTIQMN